MCEVWPGPRCNDRCKDRDLRYAVFKEVARQTNPQDVDYKTALHSLIASQKIYDTTPRGIEELRNEFIDNNSTALNKLQGTRLIHATATRKMQSEALKEIQNGRVDALAEIVTTMSKGYEREEVESIITSSRINRENFVIFEAEAKFRNGNKHTLKIIDNNIKDITKKSGSEYYDFIDRIKVNIDEVYNGEPPQKLIDAINTLDNLEPPSEVNLHAYRSIGNAMRRSNQQTAQELKRIAALQDSPPEIVAEYFDAYRNQYKREYSHLPSEKQPNPPKTWVEGYLPNNGISRAYDTLFIPKDPATMYAIYRLRTDMNAIPDYLKKSRKYVSIDNKEDGNYEVTEITKTGKQISKITCDRDTLKPVFKNYVKDSIFIVKNEKDIKLKNVDLSSNVIVLDEVMKKHFDYPDVDIYQMGQAFNVKEPSNLNIYSAMRKKILKTWSTKNARNNIPALDFQPSGKARLIQFVR